MSNIFNSVKGLHPKRNKFSADTYRNDFTAPLGVNIPCFWAEVPPATRFKCSASALVRLQALISPVMDNIDYYTHFWKVPYRLLENDLFTKFISGEIEAEDYDALFATPFELAQAVVELESGHPSDTDEYNCIFGNGSLLDFLGYDSSLFPSYLYVEADDEYQLSGGNRTTKLNWRGLIVYFMIHLNWYMNENVQYYNNQYHNFLDDVDTLVKEQSLTALASLLYHTAFLTEFYSSMLPHGWEKDYFTSALPNVQSGEPVTLPLSSSAPVSIPYGQSFTLVGQANGSGAAAVPLQSLSPTSSTLNADLAILATQTVEQEGSRKTSVLSKEDGTLVTGIKGQTYSTLNGTANLSEATAITINELRFANALQVFKERQMRFGKRRLEYYKGFFDVEPEDLRLQVPKYLGGGRIPINIADIEQTSQTSGESALGHLAGKGTAVAGGFAGFSTFCSEETFIIGISFAMPHITYANQLSRFKLKTNDIYDYFNPSFEHLGEQAIKNIEIFAGTDRPDGDFGYTPRFTEYRFHSNEMHGEFKGSLAYWSLGRIFDSTPALNPEFIYMQPKNFDRIFAVEGQPNMIVSMLFHCRAIKPVSKYGTPMLLA